MIGYHRVPADRFAALASGLGGPDAVRDLALAQLSKHRLLLRFLVKERPPEAEPSRAAVDVLIRTEKRDPGAVAELLGDPLVGAWAARTTRRILGEDKSPAPIKADLGQLGALAAAAALRTGLDATVETYALNGAVTLPGFGTALLGSDGPAVVAVSPGRTTVSAAANRVALVDGDSRWQPLRHLVARHHHLTSRLAIEDGNPYRDCYHAPPADRLSAAEVHEWQEMFSEAWDLLARFAPERAAELAAGMRAVVPLATYDDGVARSGTARDTFGVFGLTRPRSAAELAVTLVHEFHHSKLSALLDLMPMYEPGGSERHFAPWRTDARPTGGLLQGVYAFLGVADTWRALRSAPGLEELATREFSVMREQVGVGLAALEGSVELTPDGRQFAAGVRAALDRLLAEPVPKYAELEATAVLQRRRDAWEQLNSRFGGRGGHEGIR